MVKQFDEDGCLHAAVEKHAGKWAPHQYQATKDWAANLVARAQQLEADAASLPQRLQEHLQCGRLVLAVGAGVSISCGMPSWDALVRSAAVRALRGNDLQAGEEDATLAAMKLADDPIALAQAAELLVGREALVGIVAKELYEGTRAQSDLLRAIGALAAASHRIGQTIGAPSIVLTFNYDMLVEEELGRLGVPVSSWERNVRLSALPPGVVHVVHLHGIVRRAPPHEAGIVLTESSYGEAYLRDSSVDPLSELLERGAVPLFVGFSFRDHYVRQILHKRSLVHGGLVAAGIIAAETLVDKTRIVVAGDGALGYSPNDRVGWIKTGLDPRGVRNKAVLRLPAHLARWILASIGVEWYEVPTHANVPGALTTVGGEL